MSALNKYDFAYGSILTIFAAPRRAADRSHTKGEDGFDHGLACART